MTSRRDQRYWSVDAPGLDSAGAAALVHHAGQLRGVLGATGVDPDRWLTQHLDRDTVRLLLRALAVAAEAEALDPDEKWAIGQLAEDFQGWIDVSRASPSE